MATLQSVGVQLAFKKRCEFEFTWPVGLMDKASASGAGDSRFESWAGHSYVHFGVVVLDMVFLRVIAYDHLLDIIRPRGVTASTLDSESSDRGSNPREASFHLECVRQCASRTHMRGALEKLTHRLP